MPRFARLRATEVRDVRPGLARMTLSDGSEAYALTDLCGPVGVGDELLVNASALELDLGSGGAHVVHTNLSAPYAGDDVPGRVMKARYLAEQLPVDAFEEAAGTGSDHLDVSVLPSLAGVRVVLCVLHSHALALAATVRDAVGVAPGYVMTDGGALPFVLSDLAAVSLERGTIATAVSAGQAFGAPIESVTVASGVAALARQNIDRVVVAPGLGHLGTASPLGFSALDLVGHAAVLDGLGAATALAVRASSDDERERHRGVSHHTRSMAALAPERTVVPVPARRAKRDAAWVETLGKRAIHMEPAAVGEALARSGLSVTSMGRPLERDQQACEWLGAAAAWLAASP
ncbi:DUF3866 family protein [Candidatus Poriferisodalis sp.]|uniref:DUF3866 family protein n=2 Tax=Candidatus Poriferisodalis sp. TaxID=3101277 RepID=UPI003B5CCBA2